MNEPNPLQPSFDDWLLARGVLDPSVLPESQMRWLRERYEAEMKAKGHDEIRLQAAAPTGDLRCCASEPMAFDLQAADGTPAKVKKFSLVAYTGGAMRPGNWWREAPLVVDIQGMAIPRQSVPTDYEHGTIVGHTESIDTSQQRIKMAGVLSAFSETDDSDTARAARDISRLAAGGFPWQASLDFNVQMSRLEFVDQGASVKVNGRNHSGPVFVARASKLNRISIVANGADGDTSANIAASHKGGRPVEFTQWLQASGFDPSAMSDEQKTALETVWKASQKPPAPAPAVVPIATPVPDDSATRLATIRATEAKEYGRIDAVKARCKEFGDVEMEIEANGQKRKVGVLAHAIEAGLNEDQAELLCRRNARPKGNHTAYGHLQGSGGASGSDVTAEALEASLCIQAGIPEARVGKWFNQETMNRALSKEIRAANMTTISHEMCSRVGVHIRPGRPNDDTIRAEHKAERRLRDEGQLQASGGFSTISLSGILGNTANKILIASYEAQEVVWPLFCAVRSHNDFKVHTRYRLDSEGSFRKIGPDGELEHFGLGEASYTNQLDTYGAIVALNRQMRINDDLDSFAQIPTILGRLGAIRPEEAFFVHLLSNPSSFFASGNNNIITGGTGALTHANGLAAITLAETKYSNMVDSNNKPILTPPDRILCGTVNHVPARNIYNGKLKITGENSTQVGDDEHAGKYVPHKSPYVNNTLIKDQDGAAITGQSSTIWWLFADPSRLAAFAMAFLNGQRMPTMESSDVEFTMLGMQWRAYSDFGVGSENPAGAVQIDGA